MITIAENATEKVLKQEPPWNANADQVKDQMEVNNNCDYGCDFIGFVVNGGGRKNAGFEHN